MLTHVAIAVLFFLHGAKLSRSAVLEGIGARFSLIVMPGGKTRRSSKARKCEHRACSARSAPGSLAADQARARVRHNASTQITSPGSLLSAT